MPSAAKRRDAPAMSESDRLRARMVRAIERLLDALDRLDGDADHEPALGFLERSPSVTWPYDGRNGTGSQCDLAAGTHDDREEEHDGAEPDVDTEPSLGARVWLGDFSNSGVDQRSWTHGDDSDREHDPAENGIADADGAAEQGLGSVRNADARSYVG